jgi:hypothetical protein
MAKQQGRTDAYVVLKDTIATMDLDVQHLKRKAETGDPLSPGDSMRLANYNRALAECTTKQTKWDEERLRSMKDEDLKALAAAASKEMRERAGVS